MIPVWNQLQHPPARYKSVSLWLWNDKLIEKQWELQRLQPCEAGMKDFFMSARNGLYTLYKLEKWLNTYLVNAHGFDPLSQEGVQQFIAYLEEGFEAVSEPNLAKHMTDIQADESYYPCGDIPWYAELPDTFEAMHGYPIGDVLPALLMDTDSCRKARYDYWCCVTYMYEESYVKPMGKWFASKDQLIHWHLAEDLAMKQGTTVQDDPSAIYKYMLTPHKNWLSSYIDQLSKRKEHAAFQDYFARLFMVLAKGIRQTEVLLLHPGRTAWVELVGRDTSGVLSYQQKFVELNRWLSQMLVEYDSISESTISSYGKVENGQIVMDHALYQVVVIPPSVTLDRKTVEVLQRFVSQGGQLITFDPVPTLINGEPKAELNTLLAAAARLEWNSDALYAELVQAGCPSLQLIGHDNEIITSDNIHALTLELEGSYVYYIVNGGQEYYSEAQVELFCKGHVQLVNLENGCLELAQYVQTETGVRLWLPLQPGQSYMLKVDPSAYATAINRRFTSQ